MIDAEAALGGEEQGRESPGESGGGTPAKSGSSQHGLIALFPSQPWCNPSLPERCLLSLAAAALLQDAGAHIILVRVSRRAWAVLP